MKNLSKNLEMEQWEYKIVVLERFSDRQITEEYGKNGWELVCLEKQPKSWALIFKRKIKQTKDGNNA